MKRKREEKEGWVRGGEETDEEGGGEERFQGTDFTQLELNLKCSGMARRLKIQRRTDVAILSAKSAHWKLRKDFYVAALR